MICKDCIHYEVCEALANNNGIMRVSPQHCGFYKNAADVESKSEAAKEIFADIEEISGVYETPFNIYITIREQKYDVLKKKHIERRKI